MCNAAKIWGCSHYDDVDELQKFFIKQIFKLPSNTPTYAIHLETRLPERFEYTLHLHFDEHGRAHFKDSFKHLCYNLATNNYF